MSDDVVLAERRRRKKWTLNPRGKFWTDDDNKLGQKMLEKMGWSKGKGLGAQEQGMSDPILVHGNNESKGLGFQGNPDQWLNHQEDFDDILASLNASNPAEEKKKPTSLEERSKSSKSRVHYHKFTRGKDLSNWKESDLACIFGKKSSRKRRSTSTKEVEPTKEAEGETVESTNEEEIGTVSNQHGVIVIKGGSMADYFAKKLKYVGSSSFSTTEVAEDLSDADERPSFSGAITERAGFGANSWVSGGFQERTGEEVDTKEMSKLRKKRKQEVAEADSDLDERPSFSSGVTERPGFGANSWVSGGFQERTDIVKEMKKSKKKKRLEEYSRVNDESKEESHIRSSDYSSSFVKSCHEEKIPEEEENGGEFKRKKKKKKHKSHEIVEEVDEVLDYNTMETEKKKPKKKKKQASENEETRSQLLDEEESSLCDKEDELEDSREARKKKKKRKKELKEDLENHELEPKKKKKKKKAVVEDAEEISHRKKEKLMLTSNDYQWQHCSKEMFNQVSANPPRPVKTF